MWLELVEALGGDVIVARASSSRCSWMLMLAVVWSRASPDRIWHETAGVTTRHDTRQQTLAHRKGSIQFHPPRILEGLPLAIRDTSHRRLTWSMT
jgi:hypothetical protein